MSRNTMSRSTVSSSTSTCEAAPAAIRAPCCSVSEAIFTRHSVRDFVGRVGRQQVKQLLEAAVHAPTARHQEPWAFLIVQDLHELDRLSAQAVGMIEEELTRAGAEAAGLGTHAFLKEDTSIFYNAETLIVICACAAVPYAQADCWLAAENLMLAACAQGLGTCVIGSACTVLNLPETRARLGIPADHDAVVPIIVGNPAGPVPASKRHPPRLLAWLTGGRPLA